MKNVAIVQAQKPKLELLSSDTTILFLSNPSIIFIEAEFGSGSRFRLEGVLRLMFLGGFRNSNTFE